MLKAYLPGPERLLLDAALALGDPLAVAERLAREVLAAPAVIADHHADVADRHDRLGDRFDRGEPAVDEVGAVGQRDVLQAAAAAGAEERLGVLEVVVEVLVVAVDPDRRGDDLAGRQRRTVVHRHDPHAVDHRSSCPGLSGSGASTGPPMITGLNPSFSLSSFCQLTSAFSSFEPPASRR